MELTLTQLQAVTLGALDICREEEGFRFFRMTETQAAAFTRANETFAPKCRTSSGVRLDFETDSTFLEMCWTKPVFAAPTFCWGGLRPGADLLCWMAMNWFPMTQIFLQTSACTPMMKDLRFTRRD